MSAAADTAYRALARVQELEERVRALEAQIHPQPDDDPDDD